ncbi:MAG: hypothetical protein L7U47_06825 [Alphaproteobacteria bacterium]|nr:hypothetical protein [Alphaproteobacteria bacterium]
MPKTKNKFVWYYFGTLEKPESSGGFVFAKSKANGQSKMSIEKYKSSANEVLEKLELFYESGIEVDLCVSQNTSDWSQSEWFSGVRESKGESEWFTDVRAQKSESDNVAPEAQAATQYISRPAGRCSVCGNSGYVSNDWDGPCFECGRSSGEDYYPFE